MDETRPLTPKDGLEASKSLADAHEAIQKAFERVRERLMAIHPDCDLRVDYTYRSPKFQMELFKKGREWNGSTWVESDPKSIVTHQDGTIKRSHHNTYPAQAADIYIVRGGKILWGNNEAEAALYVELGRIWEEYGLVSGATWKYHWKDLDHVQVDYKIV